MNPPAGHSLLYFLLSDVYAEVPCETTNPPHKSHKCNLLIFYKCKTLNPSRLNSLFWVWEDLRYGHSGIQASGFAIVQRPSHLDRQ